MLHIKTLKPSSLWKLILDMSNNMRKYRNKLGHNFKPFRVNNYPVRQTFWTKILHMNKQRDDTNTPGWRSFIYFKKNATHDSTNCFEL